MTTLCCHSSSSNKDCDRTFNGPDTLTVGTTGLAGLDSLQLVAADSTFTEIDGAYALLVVRDGYLALEKYYNGADANSQYELRSVTKTVVGSLTGIAIEEGHFELDTKLETIFPDYYATISDPRAHNIRIRHLLTMSAGYRWNESSDQLLGNYVQWAVTLPMDTTPGTVFNYSSAIPHILSGVITRTTGHSTYEFAEEHLFSAMMTDSVSWATDPQGIAVGGTGLQWSSRAMARFGMMYMNRGIYDGQQLMTCDWVKNSIADQDPGPMYGFLWWKKEISGHETAYALGYGGQIIALIPDLRLVVVTLADPNVNLAKSQATIDAFFEVIQDRIVPSVIGNE